MGQVLRFMRTPPVKQVPLPRAVVRLLLGAHGLPPEFDGHYLSRSIFEIEEPKILYNVITSKHLRQ